MSGRLYDITQPIGPGIPVWPGDTAYQSARHWSISPDCPVPDCPVNVSRLTLSSHTGTHADAPLHYDAAGRDIASVDLSPYLGPAQVIYLLPGPAMVQPSHLADRLVVGVTRVLLRTYAAFPLAHWREDFTAVAAATIDLLAARGVRLIGVDAPSLDPQTSKTMDAHHAVRRHGMAILEGLVLDQVPEGIYELIALPLPFTGVDASPVRAVLRSFD